MRFVSKRWGSYSIATDWFIRKLQEQAGQCGRRVIRLAGNHDVHLSALLSHLFETKRMADYDQGRYRELLARIRRDILDGKIQAACVANNVLVTHAGLTEKYRRTMGLKDASLETIAARLNEMLCEAIAEVERARRLIFNFPIAGIGGPLLVRPKQIKKNAAFGLVQVFAHTPDGEFVRAVVNTRDRGPAQLAVNVDVWMAHDEKGRSFKQIAM